MEPVGQYQAPRRGLTTPEPTPEAPRGPLSGPDFLIVGSPRSGTTLAQRLACELPGVGMPPETHFFDLFVPKLLEHGPAPLEGRRLRDEIDRWREMDEVRGMEIDPDALIEDLGGRCGSLVDLFAALVRRLAPPSSIYGEKTPKHLLWWRQLASARPQLKIVAVVRDPRSVVASNLIAPWARGISTFNWGDELYVAMAERWRAEQTQTLKMASELGDRCLVLRYESVVTHPAEARAAMAALLGVDGRRRPPTEAADPSIVLPWETWKNQALGDIDVQRTASWIERLGRRRSNVVAAVCGPVMRAFGYKVSERDRAIGTAATGMLDLKTQRRRVAYRKILRGEVEWINGLTL